MHSTEHAAKHFRAVFFGGNWTDSNLKDQLADITWEQAMTQVGSLNTIAALTYHIGYFVGVALRVLQGGPLEGNDKYSYDHPPIESQEDWERLVNTTLTQAGQMADLIADLPEEKLWEDFVDKKYGNYYANIHGIIEHTHYHLGQIAVIGKMVREGK